MDLQSSQTIQLHLFDTHPAVEIESAPRYEYSELPPELLRTIRYNGRFRKYLHNLRWIYNQMGWRDFENPDTDFVWRAFSREDAIQALGISERTLYRKLRALEQSGFISGCKRNYRVILIKVYRHRRRTQA